MANEKRLIDANALIDSLYDNEFAMLCPLDEVSGVVDSQPTVNAVEVVRCKDCKHMEIAMGNLRWCNVWDSINGMGDDGYCNYGERRCE